MLSELDLKHLRRCVELAEKALDGGNPPFGSLLVDASGEVLVEDCNQLTGGDVTYHPELAVARWASIHMNAVERARATVYASGEHCPKCAAAHGWAGLGRIVYASSAAQLAEWMAKWGVEGASVRPLAIEQVLRRVQVDGPASGLADEIRELQRRYFHDLAAG